MAALEWPNPPIWPEDLPLIRALLTDEEYAALLRRLVPSAVSAQTTRWGLR